MSKTSSQTLDQDSGRFFHSTPGSRLTGEAVIASAEPKQAVFLDRDGVLIADEGHLTDPAAMKVLPGVPEALRQLREDFYLIVITNQSCVSRSLLTEDGLQEIHEELCTRLAMDGAALDGIYYCPHHPVEGSPPYRTVCQCRKPQPGMLHQASQDWNITLSRSFMVGDKPTDAAAARAAGVNALMVGDLGQDESLPAVAAENLLAAARHIMSHSKSAGAAVPEGPE